MFISFNTDNKPSGMHILQKIEHALAMKSPPATHTQHLKEIERGGDKKKQKKWNKQKAQNQMVEIS